MNNPVIARHVEMSSEIRRYFVDISLGIRPHFVEIAPPGILKCHQKFIEMSSKLRRTLIGIALKFNRNVVELASPGMSTFHQKSSTCRRCFVLYTYICMRRHIHMNMYTYRTMYAHEVIKMKKGYVDSRMKLFEDSQKMGWTFA